MGWPACGRTTLVHWWSRKERGGARFSLWNVRTMLAAMIDWSNVLIGSLGFSDDWRTAFMFTAFLLLSLLFSFGLQ